MAYSEDLNKHLDDQNLLARDTFPDIPFKLRLKRVWEETWFTLPVLALLIFVLIYFLPIAVGFQVIALIGFASVVLGVIGWAILWFGKLHFTPEYKVHGVTIRFTDDAYYVPPEVMGAFLMEICAQWDASGVLDFPAEKILGKSFLLLKGERPVDPLNRMPAEKMVGLTYPKQRHSIVYAPYALNHKGAGYELRLLMCEALFPGRAEEADVAWMLEHGLI